MKQLCLSIIYSMQIQLFDLYFVVGLVFLTALSSCRSSESSEPSFQFDDFHHIDLASKGEIISEDADLLGIVYNIKVVNDSIIAISQHSPERHVVMYNINSGKWQPVIKKGMGPKEMLNITSLSVDQDHKTLWVSGTMDKKIMKVEWNDSVGNANPELIMTSPYDLLRGISDGKGGIIGLPALSRELRMVRFDKTGVVTDSLSDFPVTDLSDAFIPSNFMFQADISYCPQNDRIAIVNRSWNAIEIRSFSDSVDITLKAPLKEDIKIVELNRGGGISYVPSPLWFLFSQVAASKRSFIVGHIGVKVEKDEDFNRYISQLLEFDWQGQPMNLYHLTSEAVAFDIDFENGFIYTVENNPDPVLMRYKI